MKYFPLIWAGLWRKPTRTILTLLSVSVAFLLFGMLHGVIAGFDTGIQQMSESRIRVTSRAGILSPMPLSHLSGIETVEGVEGVGYAAIFPSYFQQQTNPIGAAGLKMNRFLQGFPDVELSEGTQERMDTNRRGAIIGADMVENHGWKIGDTVTLTSAYWEKEDGSRDWEFEIAGIFKFKNDALPANEFWFHYEYLDEARSRQKGTAHMYFVSIGDPEAAGRISADIDKLFINTPYPTISQMEQDWLRGRLEQLGNIQFFVNAIIGAVLFTLLFLTGNTMMQSVRERVPEFAVLKTYGFSNNAVVSLVLFEAAVLCLVAAFIGLGLAAAVYPNVFAGLGVGKIPMPVGVFRDGAVIALILAILSTVPPAWRAQQLSIIDGLAAK